MKSMDSNLIDGLAAFSILITTLNGGATSRSSEGLESLKSNAAINAWGVGVVVSACGTQSVFPVGLKKPKTVA